MVEVFKYVDKFFTSLTNYLTYNYIFLIFVGLFLFTIFCVVLFTSKSYEARLIKAVDKFNAYFIDNPQINEENLVAFNNKMKHKKVPKQLRKNWQQYVLYREDKASTYMSFENCVSTPMKNSTYKRDVKLMNTLAWVFSLCALILNCYYCFETGDIAAALRSIFLTPVIILLLNYVVQIFLTLRHSAIVSDLFQNYQYFEVNIDKATETLPEYVDYEVLFDRNEIKKGIPILYTYLQKRAEEEQRELERARLKNVEHEKFNFDDQGVAASLVLERAMQEAENYIAERKKYNQDIGQINSDITQEDMNYREITKEYNRQMQVSKETFANFKSQLEEVSSTIEANYLKKQQQQELDRQRNLERDFDTATEKHKKVIESYHAELDTVDKFIAQSRKALEDAMKSEFSAYSSKVYDEAKKVAEERLKEKLDKSKTNIIELEEELVAKKEELEEAYAKNQEISDKLQTVLDENQELLTKTKTKKSKNVENLVQLNEQEDRKNEEPSEEVKPNFEEVQQAEQPVQVYKPLFYKPLDNNSQEKEVSNVSKYSNFEETDFDDDKNVSSPVINNKLEFVDDWGTPVNVTVDENKFEDEDGEDEGYLIDEAINENSEDLTVKNKEDENAKELQDASVNLESTEDYLKELQRIAEELDKVQNNISTETNDDGIEEKSASRRGRPRKVVDANEQTGEKKKRGRPRKKVNTEKVEVKKGRGRPRKENLEEKPVAIKKGRGRPKKVVSQDNQLATVVKKGRGRPKKNINAENPVMIVKKGRGRPRKEETTENVITAKRGRGRPRKDNLEEKPVVAIKKGRGRPKKIQSPIKKRGRPSLQSQNFSNDIKDIDAYLKEIDDAIAAENAKLEETQKELAKKAKLRRKK